MWRLFFILMLKTSEYDSLYISHILVLCVCYHQIICSQSCNQFQCSSHHHQHHHTVAYEYFFTQLLYLFLKRIVWSWFYKSNELYMRSCWFYLTLHPYIYNHTSMHMYKKALRLKLEERARVYFGNKNIWKKVKYVFAFSYVL